MYRVLVIVYLICHTACNSQPTQPKGQLVGGPCEGCEAIFEYGGTSLEAIANMPTDPKGNPPLKIQGTVYQQDGKTPAPGILLYFYQTNSAGVYEPEQNAEGWARRHGKHRVWLKTDQHGHYTLHTFRPGPYPGRPDPEHIHIVVKEPQRNEYYLDSFHFADDARLDSAQKQRLTNRGGSGILQLELNKAGIWVGTRDIILGKNIPNYH